MHSFIFWFLPILFQLHSGWWNENLQNTHFILVQLFLELMQISTSVELAYNKLSIVIPLYILRVFQNALIYSCHSYFILFKVALCCFCEVVQTQNFEINNVNEVITQTFSISE